MKLRLDATKCSGYGACADACPTMFKIDEFGYAALQRNGSVPAEEEGRAQLAIRNCAQHAISVANTEGAA
jgi:ferredoxin